MQQVVIAGRYRLRHPIGSGGMGRVWLARDEMLHRDVAIKEVLPPDWMTGPERKELHARTMREAQTAARLNHPNVVQIYDVAQSAESPWIVMEYVPSRSVQEVLQSDGPVSPARAAEIGLAVLAALRAAHRAGVLHRDVKPHNVLIADDGRVVLTDFGLATIDGGDGAMTQAGVVLGSPQYVAPERAADGSSTVEADLWSLGATLYAAVEGRSPYARPTTMATLTALAVAPPDPMAQAGPLRPVLAGLLRREPRQRLTAAEAEHLLREIIESPPNSEPRRHRRAWPARATAVFALVTALSVAVAVHGERRRDTDQVRSGPVPPARLSTFACTAPAKETVPVPRAPMSSSAPYALSDLWTWWADPSGFRVAVPVGWRYYHDGDVACFREAVPGTGRMISIDPATPPAADPDAYWAAEEKRLTGDGALIDYERISIEPLELYRGGAAWECRWTNAAGHRVRINRMLINVSENRAYTLSWLTPDADWQVNQSYLRVLRSSFQPSK